MSPAKLTRHAQIAAVTSALMIAQQVAAKAARDALFLSSFHASDLPFAMAAGAVLSLAAINWSSRMMTRRSPAAMIPALFALNGIAFGLEWALQFGSPRAAAAAVYLHTALLGPIIVSTFWSLINERFDPHAAKNAIARIAGGGTLGGVLGGLAAWRASAVVQPATVLPFLAILNGLALLGTLFVPSHEPASAQSPARAGAPGEETVGAFATLRSTPFLRNLGWLVLLGAASSALLDYVFSAQAVAHFGKGQALLSFFSLFWLAVGVVSFLLQLALGRLALEKLGLAVNIAVLPGIIILGSVFGLAMPGLASASLLRGAEAMQRNTLFRSAYELLYTPLREKQKRATKALIDIGFDRVGTVVGSGLALLALHAVGGRHASVMLAAVVILALATLPLTRRLHLGYVAALEQGLKDAAEKLGHAPVSSRSRIPSAIVPAREALIEHLEELQPGGLTALLDADASGAISPIPAAGRDGDKREEISLATLQELLSPDLGTVRRALGDLKPRDPAVTCAIQLLAHGELHESARQALAHIAPSITGQLIDALLDATTDFAARRRIPRILQACSTQRGGRLAAGSGR